MGSNYSDLVRAQVVIAFAESGLSEAALSKATMIPRSTLQRRLADPEVTGRPLSPFTVNELDALADALGVPVEQFGAPARVA